MPPTISTPVYLQPEWGGDKTLLYFLLPFQSALGSLRIPPGRLLLHRFRITGGFSFFISQTWSCRREGAWTQWHILKGPAGPPWLMMTPWRKKVWPLYLRSVPKGVSSSMLAAQGCRNQHWASQPGLPGDGPEHCYDTQPPRHPHTGPMEMRTRTGVPTWESEIWVLVYWGDPLQHSWSLPALVCRSLGIGITYWTPTEQRSTWIITFSLTSASLCLPVKSQLRNHVWGCTLGLAWHGNIVSSVWFLCLQPGHQETFFSLWV